MNLSRISKAIAGGFAAALTGVVGVSVQVPSTAPDHGLIAMIATGAVSFAVGFLGVYAAPANKPAP